MASILLVVGCENKESNPASPFLVSTFNLPTSIQSIIITDDSAASCGWIPNNQQSVLSQVLSWLKNAKPYAEEIPKSQKFYHHGDFGPSVLHLITSDKHQITLYPAYYIAISGKKDATFYIFGHGNVSTIENPMYQLQYVNNVLVLDNGRDQTYIKSEQIFNWLKTNQWKLEFERG